MQSERALEKLSAFTFDSGRIIFDGEDISARDQAFMCYYLIKNKNYNTVASYLDRNAGKIEAGNANYNDVVLWLWILGEYINNTKEVEKVEVFSQIIDFSINFISREWEKPRGNWLGVFGEGTYISNIAMAYGAILSINNSIRNESAQKLLLDMRGFMFEKFLDGGKVVSKLGDKDIFADICMIAVPFSLMDAGNQILVQSIHFIEKELITKGVRYSTKDIYFGGCTRSDLACLLSWYYSEKGDLAGARRLLGQVEEVWSRDGKLYVVDGSSAREKIYYDYYLEKSEGHIEESCLSYILYAIADQNIVSREQMGVSTAEGIVIQHNPKGQENRYLSENTERNPHDPVKNENVFLKMITQPFNISQKAFVQYSINGISQKSVEMQIVNSDGGEIYWEAGIGAFAYGEQVEYRFVVEADDTRASSGIYSFAVMDWKSAGFITQISNTDNGTTIWFDSLMEELGKPCLEIKKLDDKTVKWTFSVANNLTFDNMAAINAHEISELINIKDCNGRDILEAYNRHGESFLELLTDGSGRIYKIRYKLLMKGNERFFGMGERFSDMEYRGIDIDNYVYNQYTGQKLKTYLPVPFAVSSNGYGIYLDTAMYSIFRFGTGLADMLEIETDLNQRRQSVDAYIFIGDPKEIVQGYTNITGKPVLPPKWSFGLWMSSNNWDSQAETTKQVELTKKYEIPATVLVLEQWSDEATFYIFNDAQYQVKDGNDPLRYEDFSFPEWGRWPDPKKLADDLHNEGLKLLLWQIPAQKFMDGISHAQRDEDERVMLEKGYHVRFADGKAYRIPDFEWFKRSLVPDFSNPEAKEWWFNKRLYLLEDIGIDGFKTDGGECIYGEDLRFYDGRAGDEMRNQYPNDYVGSYYKLVQEKVKGGGVTFSRAGYTGAQKYPIHWAGDECSTFEAFRASMRAGLSCGLSGIPFWSWDMGGFHGKIPTAELFIRSAQMAAFCPIMQYHTETKGEYNNDRTPWNIAERTGKPYVIDIFKRFADLRMNLLPYIYQQAIHSSKTGIPMMRTMFMEYPSDESCITTDEQYFFGDSLLVAPVLEEGSSVKDVYLPDGEWVDFWDGTKYKGSSSIKYSCDIDKIPVFIKNNSVIPMNLNNDFEIGGFIGNETDKYKNLCFIVYGQINGEYVFSDDLGNQVLIGNDERGLNVEMTGDIGKVHILAKNHDADFDVVRLIE